MGCQMLIVESDLAVAYNMIQNRSRANATFQPLLRKIGQMMDREWDISINHIYREANFCADWLANKAYNLHCEVLPRGIYLLLLADMSRSTKPSCSFWAICPFRFPKKN